jgi:hypothetical protein
VRLSSAGAADVSRSHSTYIKDYMYVYNTKAYLIGNTICMLAAYKPAIDATHQHQRSISTVIRLKKGGATSACASVPHLGRIDFTHMLQPSSRTICEC